MLNKVRQTVNPTVKKKIKSDVKTFHTQNTQLFYPGIGGFLFFSFSPDQLRFFFGHPERKIFCESAKKKKIPLRYETLIVTLKIAMTPKPNPHSLPT